MGEHQIKILKLQGIHIKWQIPDSEVKLGIYTILYYRKGTLLSIRRHMLPSVTYAFLSAN